MKMIRIKSDIEGSNEEIIINVKFIELIKLDGRNITISTDSGKTHMIEFQTVESADKQFEDINKILAFLIKILYIDSDAETMPSKLIVIIDKIEAVSIDCRYIFITTQSGTINNLEFEDVYQAEKKYNDFTHKIMIAIS